MQLLLFSIIAICIAGSRTQEIAIGTDYLRAHFKDSIASTSAINTQNMDSPPAGFLAINAQSSTPATTIATTIDADNSPGKDDTIKNTNYDHEHQSHHEHAATISIDVHNILDLFKQQLHATEERILAAIQHTQPLNNPAPALKSYRTGDR